MPAFSPQGNIKLLLLSGFSLVIILMALIIYISMSEFEQSSQQLQQIVHVNNTKQRLVEKMHISAFQRVSSLQRMLLLTDPFDRDNEAMLIDEQGSIFTRSRQKLLETQLNQQEIDLLKQQAEYAKVTVPAIREITHLIQLENLEQAQKLIQEELIPAQSYIFNALNKLQKIQEKNTSQAFDSMLQTQAFSRAYMLTLGTTVAILSILIAFLTYKKVRRTEKQLSNAKERAQISLKNIADGVITTDEDGLIDFINPVAAAMTGYSETSAIGQPMLDILRLTDLKMRQACASIEEFKDCNKKELLLISRDNNQIPIEHSTSILPSDKVNNKGLVVIFRNVTEARELTETLSYQATHDPLTDLHNRKAFEEKLSDHIHNSRNKEQSHILCFLDLDHFKQVNDNAGHVAGDELLKDLSKILLKNIRNSDFLARIGGDEFAIMLENCSTDKALDITEDIRSDVEAYAFDWMGTEYKVSVSIGITKISKQATEISEVLEQADQACYEAKNSGKNLIKFFTEEKSASSG